MKSITEYINESSLETGYWHGNDAYILDGNKNDGYTILVGDFDNNEAKKVQRLVKADKPLGKYEDFVVYAEPDEWDEQQ